jgi:uncharacterized membrane protein
LSQIKQQPDAAAVQTSAHAPAHGITIQDAAAWVLRVGVIVSVSVMLIGITFSFAHGTTPIERMQHSTFEYRLQAILDGVRHGSGKSIIEVGIYLLVLTPILRVVTSMVLFAVEKDWLYACVTLLVLVLTLAGLLFLK